MGTVTFCCSIRFTSLLSIFKFRLTSYALECKKRKKKKVIVGLSRSFHKKKYKNKKTDANIIKTDLLLQQKNGKYNLKDFIKIHFMH